MTHHRLKKKTIQDHSGNLESTHFHWNVLGSSITNLLEYTWVFRDLLEKWGYYFYFLTLQSQIRSNYITVGLYQFGGRCRCCSCQLLSYFNCAKDFCWKYVLKIVLLTRQNVNSSRNSFIRICFRPTTVQRIYCICFIFILWDAYKSLVICISQMTNVGA